MVEPEGYCVRVEVVHIIGRVVGLLAWRIAELGGWWLGIHGGAVDSPGLGRDLDGEPSLGGLCALVRLAELAAAAPEHLVALGAIDEVSRIDDGALAVHGHPSCSSGHRDPHAFAIHVDVRAVGGESQRAR